MAPHTPPSILPSLQPVSDDELAAVLAAAICDGRSSTMTRGAEVFLATLCAEFLVERMATAGLVVMRDWWET
jgi:hypothetical protein